MGDVGPDAAIEMRMDRGTMKQSLHASKSFPLGLICSFTIQECTSGPSRLTLQISSKSHALILPDVLRTTNHSCSPNAFFNVESMTLEALKPIEEGEEITIAYWATEWSMAESFKCECGSSECQKSISGAKSIKGEVLRKWKLNPFIYELKKKQEEGNQCILA